MTKENTVTVIGGGLAGSEAAVALARRGINVRLYEMKPQRFSPAHKMEELAELVCSNSLGSESESSASGLLKEEMRALSSAVIAAAEQTRVPAGQALAVDRTRFAQIITKALNYHKNIEIIREEIERIPDEGPVIIATGPLTSDALVEDIKKRLGGAELYFYDAISPIVTAESINWEVAWKASRYDKGGADYVNLPMNEARYHEFINGLLAAEQIPFRDFEKNYLFEGCMPIEELASRGPETPAHGPMKPVGLIDPRTGRQPYAVVQLRTENARGTLYNLVGFQTKLKQGEQGRVFRTIPGLEEAEFARWGSLHRNTYIDAPRVLTPNQELKSDERVLVAGQLVGVEGYLESSAGGIIAGMCAAAKVKGKDFRPPPPTTLIGALLDRIKNAPKNYQPMNANFGILPPAPKSVKKKERKKWYRERALNDLKEWLESVE